MDDGSLSGEICLPHGFNGLVLFAHGDSSRKSLRNRHITTALQESGLGTLLFDLLTKEEEKEGRGGEEESTIHKRTLQLGFNDDDDIQLLADRLVKATDSVLERFDVSDGDNMPPIGYFGAGMEAAATLVAASRRSDIIKAVVSRGGLPHLAGSLLQQVRAPTMLVVGSDDDKEIVDLNKKAFSKLSLLADNEKKRLEIIPEATHLLEKQDWLEQQVSKLAADWFVSSFKDRRRP